VRLEYIFWEISFNDHKTRHAHLVRTLAYYEKFGTPGEIKDAREEMESVESMMINALRRMAEYAD